MPIFKKIMNWARIKSPWILHFNSGACNACDIEIIAALTPRYDIERFGIQLKGSPRHADVLVCSGPVTRQIEARLKRIYEQMPEPKFVVAVGT
ncbi:MAG: NADH-quinone oxidoreductase subunit B, partial [Candidatus Omnitrophica bacterium]|nr:NADH-quinone oxidoreductase subunit B [Candidatus Omnitrophota bacterium]